MKLWEYILLAIVTALFTIITSCALIVIKHRWNNPLVKGIIKMCHFDISKALPTMEEIKDQILRSLLKDQNALNIIKGSPNWKGNIKKTISLTKSELFGLTLESLGSNGISLLIIIETTNVARWALVINPKQKVARRISNKLF